MRQTKILRQTARQIKTNSFCLHAIPEIPQQIFPQIKLEWGIPNQTNQNSKYKIKLYFAFTGLSAKSRTRFRIVTALAPPFVMVSDIEKNGNVCLRGLECHQLLPGAQHNLTSIFNEIETRKRTVEDAEEHGTKPFFTETEGNDRSLYT